MLSEQEQRDAQMLTAFHSTDPPLTRFPHCIFYNHGRPAAMIAEITNTPVGVWGDRCFVDANGEPYLEPEDGRVIEDFSLWSLPKNQEYALEFTSKACGFCMVIPANTSLDVLRKTYDLAGDEFQAFDYETYIKGIASLVPELGWAYIPLEYEHDYAIFVTSHENKHYVDEFKRRLAEAGNTKFFDVSATESGQQWNGPILWDTEAHFGPTKA